ncbi:MAG: glutathione S-transferase family protein [Nannocystis sp.]|nr:glutathione S-transferase family protein [Nannocystis sp.]MBA3549836.1 glutathione S-transferase family protein [Nannocystis sp.]
MIPSNITCYALENVPPVARGVVRDLRVRWALEECGIAYQSRLVGTGPGTLTPAEYLKIQPFGQVPSFQDGELTLFESGAIVLHLAEEHEALMSTDRSARAHTKQWMFAALNTIEPQVQQLAEIDLFHPDAGWVKERRPGVLEAVQRRLKPLAAHLADRDYLLDRFTAADLLMSTVLRTLRHTAIVEEHPALHAYKQRCEARPAFERALAAQLADFVPWQPRDLKG